MRALRSWLMAAVLVATGMLASAGPVVAATAPSACDLPAGSPEGRQDRAYRVKAKGTVQAVMLFVDFPDVTTTDAFDAYKQQLLPARAWFKRSSFDQLKLRITTVDHWYRMPHDSTDYDFQRGLTFESHKAYIRDAIEAADADVDFSDYQIVYIVPADNAAAISFSPAFVGGPSGVAVDGTVMGFGATFGQDMWTFGPKVLNHETGHLFGLPDLYAYDPVDFATDHRFVGGWDLMGWILGPAPDLFAWHKWHLGWFAGSQVRCLVTRGSSITVDLSPVETASGVKLAIVRLGTQRVIAVEVRAAQGNDAALCRPGVVIYQLLGDVDRGDGPLRVMPAAADDPDRVEACGLKHAAAFRVGGGLDTATYRIRVLSRSGSSYRVQLTRK